MRRDSKGRTVNRVIARMKREIEDEDESSGRNNRKFKFSINVAVETLELTVETQVCNTLFMR